MTVSKIELPTEFYKRQEASVVGHTSISNGDLDIGFLLEGRSEHWYAPQEPTSKKPKVLIISDWRAPTWDRKTKSALSIIFMRLLDEGFSLWRWNNDLFSVTEHNLSYLFESFICEESLTVGADVIYSMAMSELGVPRDHLLILDDYWIDHLLYARTTIQPRQVKLSDIIKNTTTYLAFSSNNRFSPPLTIVVQDVFSLKANAELEKIQALHPTIHTVTEYTALCLYGDQISDLVRNKRLELDNLSLEPSDLAKIEKLTLWNWNITEKELTFFLKNLKQLKVLSLMGCQHISLISTKNLSHLEEIFIDNNRYLNSRTDKDLVIEAHQQIAFQSEMPGLLDSIWSKSEYLTRLALHGLDFKNFELSETGFFNQLLYLREIDLANCDISDVFLNKLFQLAPNLTSISVDYLNSGLRVQSPLLHLTSIVIKQCDDSMQESLAELLRATPNLERLSIYGSLDALVLLKDSLKKLKLVTLSDTLDSYLVHTFGSKVIENLLHAAPNLVYLEITTGIRENTPSFNYHHKSRLETIILRKTSLSSSFLLLLLKGFTNLTSVTFKDVLEKKKLDSSSDSDGFSDDDEPWDLPRNPIKHLSLSNNPFCDLETFEPINEKKLESLLRSSSETLTSFFMSTEQRTYSSINLKPGSLRLLRRIGLDFSNCDDDFVRALILAAPNVTELQVSSDNTTRDSLEMISMCANKLKKLDVPSNIASLAGLFKKVPVLQIHNFIELDLLSIEHLFLAMPNITEFYFSIDTMEIFENIEASSVTMPGLKKIHLLDQKISNLHLKRLRMIAPNAHIISNDPLFSFDNESSWPENKLKPWVDDPRKIRQPSYKPMIVPSGSCERKYLDADTSDKSGKFSLHRIFYGLLDTEDSDPAYYHQAEMTENTCDINKAFQLSTPEDWDLDLESHEEFLPTTPRSPTEKQQFEELICIGRNTHRFETRWPLCGDFEINEFLHTTNESYDLFYGKHSLYVGTKWQMLPSLSSEERMIHYQLSSHNQFEISYSKRDSRYCIRRLSGKPGVIEIEMIFRIKKELSPLPEEIQSIVDSFFNFLSGPLMLDESNSFTGEDYLQAIMTQKKGACRHRAFAFKCVMQQNYPQIPVRIIMNDCHAFAEVQIEKTWHQCDLGGYDAEITIIEAPIEAPKFVEEALYLSDYESEESSEELDVLIEAPLTQHDAETKEDPRVMDFIKHSLISIDMPRRRLITCESEGVAHALQFVLYEQANTQEYRFFSVDGSDQLVCSSNEIYRDDQNIGTFRKGPSGELYQFLTEAKQNPLQIFLLAVDFSSFSTAAIIRSNELFDDVNPSIDTIKVPENIKIIAFINTGSSECYQGDDFHSRFDEIIECPISFSQIEYIIPKILSEDEDEFEAETARINLFNGVDWERQLLGSWKMKGQQLTYCEGILQTLFGNGMVTRLVIENGPWENKAFLRFWQKALHTHVIKHAGSEIKLSEHLQLRRQEGYNWTALINPLRTKPVLPCEPLHVEEILNPGRFQHFFTSYRIRDGEYEHLNGLIQETHGSPLKIRVTRNLNDHEWARFLNECHRYQVNLSITLIGPIDLPVAMQEDNLNIIFEKPFLGAKVIKSTDVETTVVMLSKQTPSALVLDISEMSSADLLVILAAEIDQESLTFRCSETIGILQTSLNKHRPVILKGLVSNDLADALAPLLLQENRNDIVIVTDNTSMLPYLHVEKESINTALKRECLGELPNEFPQHHIETESLSQLQARKRYLAIHPQGNSDDAWEGVSSLKKPKPELAKFDKQTFKLEAEQHTNERITQILQVLALAPYVLITGHSGVGKTTFLLENFGPSDNPHRIKLHQGEAAIQAWADDRSEAEYTVLFIDEANLSPKQWSQFDGLFRTPPFIIIKGKEHLLTPKHKVIFAGNPANYSDDRSIAPFFKDHGNAVVFQPLPMAILYLKILDPIFCDLSGDPEMPNAIKHVLELYGYLCDISLTEVLISPRELQMIALLTIAYKQRDPRANLAEIIAFYAYVVAKQLVPNQHLSTFEELFKPSKMLNDRHKAKESKDFLFTPSRQPLFDLLMDMLSLRELRQSSIHNLAKRYGGINGIIIEGPSGVGKSQLVVATLEMKGVRYYKMPAGMRLKQQIELLIRAFHEGAVVIADEMNTQGMKEQLLNALLMGKDLEGNPPKQAGFMFIGTQNSAAMLGRSLASLALSRRFLRMTLDPYGTFEQENILKHQGFSEKAAIEMSVRSESNIRLMLSKSTPNPISSGSSSFIDAWADFLSSDELGSKRSLDVLTEYDSQSLSFFNPNESGKRRRTEDEDSQSSAWFFSHMD